LPLYYLCVFVGNTGCSSAAACYLVYYNFPKEGEEYCIREIVPPLLALAFLHWIFTINIKHFTKQAASYRIVTLDPEPLYQYSVHDDVHLPPYHSFRMTVLKHPWPLFLSEKTPNLSGKQAISRTCTCSLLLLYGSSLTRWKERDIKY